MKLPFSSSPFSAPRESQASEMPVNPTEQDIRVRRTRPRMHPLMLFQHMLRNKWLKLGLRLGSTLLLFTFLLRSISWPMLGARLNKVDLGLLSIGLIVGIFGVIISAYQWQSLLEREHIRVDLRRLINLYLVGIAFNHFLPTGMGGDLVKAYYVGRESQNSPAVASALVMSRFTGFLGMTLVSVPTVLVWHAMFKPELTVSFLLSCLMMCVALGVAFLVVTVLPHVTHRWLRGKAQTSLLNVGSALRKSMQRPHTMGVAVLYGMGFHFSAALNFYCYSRALGVNSVPVTFFLVAVPFVSLISFLPISINGFGVRESAFVYIFSQMNMRHASPEVSLALVLLMDVQVLLYGLAGGCIYLLMGMRKDQQALVNLNSARTRKMSPHELSV